MSTINGIDALLAGLGLAALCWALVLRAALRVALADRRRLARRAARLDRDLDDLRARAARLDRDLRVALREDGVGLAEGAADPAGETEAAR